MTEASQWVSKAPKVVPPPVKSPEERRRLESYAVDFDMLHNDCGKLGSQLMSTRWRYQLAAKINFGLAVCSLVASSPLLYWSHNREDRVWRLRNPEKSWQCYRGGIALLVFGGAMLVIGSGPYGFNHQRTKLDSEIETFDNAAWDSKILWWRCLRGDSDMLEEVEVKKVLPPTNASEEEITIVEKMPKAQQEHADLTKLIRQLEMRM